MTAQSPSVSVLFVCLGNICRSPTAEAVMRHLVERASLTTRIAIDSAGTGDWHVGHPPDERSRAVGRDRGMPLSGRARQVTSDDFGRFDFILALDGANRDSLRKLARDAEGRAKIFLLRDFEPGAPADSDVPDPYYGDRAGFEQVFDICLRSCEGLLAHVARRHGLDPKQG